MAEAMSDARANVMPCGAVPTAKVKASTRTDIRRTKSDMLSTDSHFVSTTQCPWQADLLGDHIGVMRVPMILLGRRFMPVVGLFGLTSGYR